MSSKKSISQKNWKRYPGWWHHPEKRLRNHPLKSYLIFSAAKRHLSWTWTLWIQPWHSREIRLLWTEANSFDLYGTILPKISSAISFVVMSGLIWRSSMIFFWFLDKPPIRYTWTFRSSDEMFDNNLILRSFRCFSFWVPKHGFWIYILGQFARNAHTTPHYDWMSKVSRRFLYGSSFIRSIICCCLSMNSTPFGVAL